MLAYPTLTGYWAEMVDLDCVLYHTYDIRALVAHFSRSFKLLSPSKILFRNYAIYSASDKIRKVSSDLV